jgi:hypothetical protein
MTAIARDFVLQCAMSEDAAQLHLRVEACRRLANKNENPEPLVRKGKPLGITRPGRLGRMMQPLCAMMRTSICPRTHCRSKRERHRLLEQIEQSQKAIHRFRDILAYNPRAW